MQIPIIDFSPFLSPTSSDEEKLATARQLDDACRKVGFFYLSDHGIPSSTLDSMLSNAKQFFDNATKDEKEGLLVKKAGDGDGDDTRGWKARETDSGAYEVWHFSFPLGRIPMAGKGG